LDLTVDLVTNCNNTTVRKSFIYSSIPYLSEKYPIFFIPRNQLFKNFFNSRSTRTPCSSLQNTEKNVFVMIEFILGTKLLAENTLQYITNWSDGMPFYKKLRGKWKIERILNKPTFFCDFVKDRQYSISGAESRSPAQQTLSLCENIIWEQLQPNTSYLSFFILTRILSHTF
jgi:hypothetical protein